MNFRKLLMVVAGVGVLALGQADVAAAQTTPDTSGDDAPAGERTTASRLNQNQNEGQRRRTPPPPTPEQLLAQAKTLLSAAGSTCQATEATSIGVTAEQQAAFEVVCNGAPGVLVVASTPPKTFDCLELAGQAMQTRERDPAADVGQQCANPVNTDPVRYVSAWATEAGVGCTVDQAAVVGKSTGGQLVYEVGCAGADGYWLSRTASGWDVSPCWDLALDSQTCRFTTAEERKSAWPAVLGTTEAQGCDVQDARRVGRDGQGLTVYEVKCGSGEGYFLRVGENRVAQRAATCAASTNVAGGCTLTTASAVAPAPAPATPSGGRA